MFCPQCGKDIKDDARFCGNCGWAVPAVPVKPVEQRCTSCGTVPKEGARFCPNCGGAVSAAPAVSTVPAATPIQPSADVAAKETTKSDKQEPKEGGNKSGAIDKAVFHHLGSQVYACYLYKGGVVVGNMTDTCGAFIPDVKEWLEKKYDNLVVEIKEKE